MGNQESVSNDTYVVKKKINKKNNNPNNQEQNNVNNQKQYNNKQQYNQQQYNNQQYNQQQYNNQQYNQQQYNNQQYNNQQYNNQQYNQQQYNQQQYNQQQYNNQNNIQRSPNYINNQTEKITMKNSSNNVILERNMLSDIYIKNNEYVTPYPSNSNNELDIPKTNFDNIKFTPYNFNDEVNKYKKTIDNERDQFEKNEKERRKIFENNEKNKKEFLNKEIKKFESEYNPWKILNLKDNDYNINNIKKAYKRMALKYHPDKVGNQYEDKFQLITQSYIYLLGKAEDTDIINKKINRVVEKVDYEDNINENVENIYIDKDKFDINYFNKIFDQYKIPNSFDKGYSDLMKEDIKNNDNDEQIFGKKFNNDIFNAHFDNKKNKKISKDIIQYNEPEALDSSNSNLNQTFFGIDDIEDFGSMNNNNLSYTDYKKAHVDENLLIDVNKVKYKTYNSIDHLESDRANISYTPSHEDKIRYEYLERKRLEDDNLRLQNQKNYDNIINKQYNKINQRLIIHNK
jgi:hypothetical protein